MNELYVIPMPKLRERHSRRAVLVGALLTAISPLMAQDRRLRLVVQDAAGAVIADATVALLDREGKVIRKMETNRAGEALWTDLPVGDSMFQISIQGFKPKTVSVMLAAVAEKRVEVKLDVGTPISVFTVSPTQP